MLKDSLLLIFALSLAIAGSTEETVDFIWSALVALFC